MAQLDSASSYSRQTHLRVLDVTTSEPLVDSLGTSGATGVN